MSFDVVICTPHWLALRKAVEDRGLGSLIADDGYALEVKLRRQKEEGVTIDTYEPLLGALIDISRSFARSTNYYVSGEVCPLCYINDNCTCPVKDCGETWITNAADDQLEVWKELRLA